MVGVDRLCQLEGVTLRSVDGLGAVGHFYGRTAFASLQSLLGLVKIGISHGGRKLRLLQTLFG